MPEESIECVEGVVIFVLVVPMYAKNIVANATIGGFLQASPGSALLKQPKILVSLTLQIRRFVAPVMSRPGAPGKAFIASLKTVCDGLVAVAIDGFLGW